MMITTNNEWCDGEILKADSEKIQVLCAPVWFRDSCDRTLLCTGDGHLLRFDEHDIVESSDGGETWSRV